MGVDPRFLQHGEGSDADWDTPSSTPLKGSRRTGNFDWIGSHESMGRSGSGVTFGGEVSPIRDASMGRRTAADANVWDDGDDDDDLPRSTRGGTGAAAGGGVGVDAAARMPSGGTAGSGGRGRISSARGTTLDVEGTQLGANGRGSEGRGGARGNSSSPPRSPLGSRGGRRGRRQQAGYGNATMRFHKEDEVFASPSSIAVDDFFLLLGILIPPSLPYNTPTVLVRDGGRQCSFGCDDQRRQFRRDPTLDKDVHACPFHHDVRPSPNAHTLPRPSQPPQAAIAVPFLAPKWAGRHNQPIPPGLLTYMQDPDPAKRESCLWGIATLPKGRGDPRAVAAACIMSCDPVVSVRPKP